MVKEPLRGNYAMAFKDEIDKEIKALQDSLDADPRIMKIRELSRIRALYDRTQGAATVFTQVATAVPMPAASDNMLQLTQIEDGKVLEQQTNDLLKDWMTHHLTRKLGGRRPSPERVQAISAVKKFLRTKSEPVPTSVLYGHLCSLGITIRGADPKNNLSAMLSSSDSVKSHGRSGWTLSEAPVPVIPNNILEAP